MLEGWNKDKADIACDFLAWGKNILKGEKVKRKQFMSSEILVSNPTEQIIQN